ncbi:MAG TPA: L-seryl-tRNA(Sec) selenium transferase [Stellaceae bacterium]
MINHRESNALRALPSVDAVLRGAAGQLAANHYGRAPLVAAIRATLDALRAAPPETMPDAEGVAQAAADRLARDAIVPPRPVFNLTGTILHTNLGRAILAEEAIEAAVRAMRYAVALEFDLDGGARGERDDHVRDLLCALTGAEDATIVNNNAAAVLLVLNTFALDRDAIVSRGELIEIGGAFRMPDIMARAGARLVEVGTTNRTHHRDYAAAIGPATGMVLKVHTSNYRVEGFTAAVPSSQLAALAHERGVLLANDLGSGTLIDLARWGLPHEPTVAEAVADGADLVTFSGDKLLGGPQAGFIVGRREAIARINRNPMKRALRVDKIRLATVAATLRLYRDPDRLAARLPTLRHLARPAADIDVAARRLAPAVATALGDGFTVAIAPCHSQIGSGALPVETIASVAVSIRAPRDLDGLTAALRALPIPVIGRIERGALLLDLRCLDDEAGFVANLAALAPLR